MINNLLTLLTNENIYLVANWGVIPFWLLLIAAPNHTLTNFFVSQSSPHYYLQLGTFIYLSLFIKTEIFLMDLNYIAD